MKHTLLITTALIITVLMLIVGFWGCEDEEVHPIVGTWENQQLVDNYMETLTLSFLNNGTITTTSTEDTSYSGTYTLLGNEVTFVLEYAWQDECEEPVGGSFSFSIDNNQLTFSTTSENPEGWICGRQWDWYFEGTWNKISN